MDWFSGKVSLGNFPDIAGAVNKLSEGVKIIEKNFDSALGFEEKSESSSSTGTGGLWPSSDRKPLFDSFMGQKDDESTLKSTEKPEASVGEKQDVETDRKEETQAAEDEVTAEEDIKDSEIKKDQTDPGTEEGIKTAIEVPGAPISDSQPLLTESHGPTSEHTESLDSINSDSRPFENSESVEAKLETNEQKVIDFSESTDEQKNQTEDVGDKVASPVQAERTVEEVSPVDIEASDDTQCAVEPGLDSKSSGTEEIERASEASKDHSDEVIHVVSEPVSHENVLVLGQIEVKKQAENYESDAKEQLLNSGTNVFNSTDSVAELEKLKSEMKMMETALQGAARQAQAKADEIARMMNENEQLKSVIEDLKRKSNEAEAESLREEYHQRVSSLERKVYALTKERDTLRREQSKKSDAAVLLKEKDEIITQVMAEGEELSKKQAAQESTIRKLRAQIREFEEEKKGLASKLQVEENKVESIKKDKAATEKLLQETMEKDQAELASQKEYYTNALAAARESVALAEAQANSEARIELESRIKEAEEREAMLVQTLEELRQTLSRQEQQAGFREDMLRRDIEDLQKRYQASERRAEELGSQFPDSTRPLLRQIEAMQESKASNQEAWAAVEANLTSRIREEEARAVAAEMKAASESERSSQYLSRVNVLEAQNSCLRAENSQLNRTIEKERQRAHENRQEYLAAKEEADTQEGRVKQLEEEIRVLKKKHKQELHEALTHRERLEQEIEREKAARLDLERIASLPPNVPDHTPLSRRNSAFDNGNLSRKLSNASSISSIEESILQASLDSYDNSSERRNLGETSMNQFYLRSMTPSAFEATLRQKEGELASYVSRLTSVESIRNALAEELVEMTARCEKLQLEANTLPALRAELEALRRRHSAALELMGERDEELEELRADIVDLKEMYREQVDLLVNKIQTMSSSSSTN